MLWLGKIIFRKTLKDFGLINSYEKGDRSPALDTLIRIAHTFGVGLDTLVLADPESLEHNQYLLSEGSRYSVGWDMEFYSLTEEEKELIRMYRSVSPDKRDKLLTSVRKEYSEND